MKEYYLKLVGLHTVLRVPQAITISESLQPFIVTPQEKTDCTIELQTASPLPAFSKSGVWNGLEYYDTYGGGARIFHCTAPKTEAFAVTQLQENGNIEIRILPDYLSYFSGTAGIFNRIGMETLLLQYQGLLLHASLINYQGNAIAFAGPSGVGKSTQADIWKRYLSAEIINGDRAALRKEGDSWIAYGSPYAGTSGIYKNSDAPLKAIVLLRQAKENRFLPLTARDAFSQLYPEITIHRWDKNFVAKATDLCLQLLADVPVYLLECRPEESAALLAKKGLGL